MMSVATFGELLGPARGHLARAAGFPDSALRAPSVIAAAAVTGRLALTLSRYLADVAPYGMPEAMLSRSLHPRMRAAVDAREALRMAASALQAAVAGTGRRGRQPADSLAGSLAAAAGTMAAGRDLLRTHFATGPDDSWSQRSDWSAVIISAPVTRAVAAEVASWSRQLASLMTRLSLAAEMDAAVPAAVRHGLAGGCQWLLAASAAITTGQRFDPVTMMDAELLHAVPANAAPQRRPPGDTETDRELAAGVAVSAERVRAATWAKAEQAAWSPAMTAESWRWTAIGAAVICDLSQTLLESLAGRPGMFAGRPGLFAGRPEVALQLRAAAQTAAGACARWRDVASAWNDITTETRGLTGPGIPDTGDLIVRLGRLAFASPQWTPARAHSLPVRDPAHLAPGPAQFTAVIAAVHHAASAVVSLAAADMRGVDVAVRASRLHVPTRTLPEGYDVPRRFANAVPATTADLLDAYQAASDASDLAAASLDALAVTVGAPSRILSLARAAIRLGPDAIAVRGADWPPARRAAAVPDGWAPEASPPPGAAELAVRQRGTPDVGLLLRASVIDRAMRALTAEMRGRSQPPGRAQESGRTEAPARSPAQVAGESFPARPVTSASGRIHRSSRPPRPTAVAGRLPRASSRRSS